MMMAIVVCVYYLVKDEEGRHEASYFDGLVYETQTFTVNQVNLNIIKYESLWNSSKIFDKNYRLIITKQVVHR